MAWPCSMQMVKAKTHCDYWGSGGDSVYHLGKCHLLQGSKWDMKSCCNNA